MRAISRLADVSINTVSKLLANAGTACAAFHDEQVPSTEIGSIDPLSIETQRTSMPVILLGGRSWRVLNVDWQRRTVSVEPTSDTGRPAVCRRVASHD